MGRMVRFAEEQARRAIEASRSWSEALRRLGYRPAGGNHRTLQKYAAVWEISTAHFDPDGVRSDALRRGPVPLDQILVEHSTYSRGHLKDRLYAAELKRPTCEVCSQDENWRGCRMAMILDHVNGVHDDNRLENLRILCPNCAATLETHCGRKNQSGGSRRTVSGEPRSCLRCGEMFVPKYRNHRYCSRACGSRWDRSRVVGMPQPDRRKAKRPPYRRLIAEVWKLGYVEVGRMYGVSGTAIRKWIRQYERERAIEEGRDPTVVEIPRRTWPSGRRARRPPERGRPTISM